MIFTKNAAASIIDMLLLVPYILGLIFMLGLRILIDIPWLLGAILGHIQGTSGWQTARNLLVKAGERSSRVTAKQDICDQYWSGQ